MTQSSLFDKLYGWAMLVLNPEVPDPENPGDTIPNPVQIPIIISHVDAPAPDALYISISASGTRTRVGRGNVQYPKSDDTIDVTQDYTQTVEIRESGGYGDVLQRLIDSTDRQDVQDYFRANDIVYLMDTDIQYLPRIPNGTWINECLVEVTVGYIQSENTDPGLIEDIEYTGTIPAEGRPGNHIITNIEEE